MERFSLDSPRMLRRRQVLVSVLILGALVAIVFGRAWDAQFVQWDDPDLVVQNPGLNPPSFAHVMEFWRRPYLGLYTPLSYTAWSGLAAITGESAASARWFHVFNVALHFVSAASLLWLLIELGLGPQSALLGAAFFAIHPLQVEPVMWVSGMNNLLAGALGIASLAAYARHLRASDAKGRCTWYGIGLVMFCLALLSKPTAVVIPAMALLIDLALFRRSLTTVTRAIFPWGIAAAAMAIVAGQVQPAPGVAEPSPFWRVAIAVDAAGFYLRQLIFPLHQNIDYQRMPGWVQSHGWSLAANTTIAIGVAALCGLRRLKWVRLPLALAAVAVLPVSGLVRFDFQVYSTVADRYMYLPMVGIAMLAALAWERYATRLVRSMMIIALAGLSIVSIHQTSVWRDSRTLGDRVLSIDPNNPTGHNILAAWLAQRDELPGAIEHYEIALGQMHARGRGEDGAMRYDYANALLRMQRVDVAIAQYRLAILTLRGFALARAWNNLGVALVRSGDVAGARSAFKMALDNANNYTDARNNLNRLGG